MEPSSSSSNRAGARASLGRSRRSERERVGRLGLGTPCSMPCTDICTICSRRAPCTHRLRNAAVHPGQLYAVPGSATPLRPGGSGACLSPRAAAMAASTRSAARGPRRGHSTQPTHQRHDATLRQLSKGRA